MDSRKFSLHLIYAAIFLFGAVICDGDHSHAHGTSDGTSATTTKTSSSDGPHGTVTTVHTTSGDPSGAGGGQDAFASILSSISPDLIQSLAANPQVAQALRSNGIDAGEAAAAAAAAGGTVQPGVGGGAYNYPRPPVGSPPIPGLGGFGGFPGLPYFGPFKSLHVSGNYGLFYPVIEKVIVFVGGGILILVILALLTKAFSKGGLFYGVGSSLSEALAGSASFDLGPIHKSVAGSAAVSASAGNQFGRPVPSLQLTQRVHDGLDQSF